MRRVSNRVIGLVLLALLVGLAGPLPARAAPGWSPAAPTQVAHIGHSAVPLPAGEVLIVGGYTTAAEGRATERYDPATGRWRQAQSPRVVTGDGAAVLLGDGSVLFYGQAGEGGAPSAAERYDPAADSWSTVAPPPLPLPSYGSLTALADGRALVVSGGQAAVYAPATNTWTPTGPLSARAGGNGHAATALRDGRVLVTGGIRGDCGKTGCLNTTAERYDPATNAWTTVAPMGQARAQHRATLLGDGRVLVVGTYGDSREVDLYDPVADTWAATARLPVGFITGGQSLTALPDGGALLIATVVVGGATSVSAALRYTPATDTWETLAAPGVPRSSHTATLLRDGRVLVVGGIGAGTAVEVYGEVRAGGACFAETGQCIDGPFLAYWQANGGLARHGFPLTAERWEILEDGNAYVVQYFERARFERHPENPPPYDVLLGQFGRNLYLLDPSLPRANAAPPLPGATYFDETGHNVRGRFLDYWQANGGLAQIGYPLSEEIRERLEDGREYTVQYFERARLELHPENAAPYDVLLGQFGRRILAASDPAGRLLYPLGDRFAPVYTANKGIRVRLNAPLAPEGSVGGAIQQFERGWMVYRADTRTIYALLGEAQFGSLPVGAAFAFPDTWDESQPPGGGAGPQPGSFEPSRGFGKVWRENPTVRAGLGYALAPTEAGQTLQIQPFVGGTTVDAPAQATYSPRGLAFIVYTNGRYEVKAYSP